MVTVRQGNEPITSIDGVGPIVRNYLPGHPDPEVEATPGVSKTLWEWNGQDVSQFDNAVAAAHLFVNTSLSVVADATLPGGNKLRLTADPGSGGGGAVWLITAPLVFTGNRQYYMIEYETENIDANSGGVAFMADDSAANFHSHQWCFGIAGEAARFDNGTWSQGGNTKTVHGLGAGSSRALVRVHIRGHKASGSQPIWSVYANSRTRHNVYGAGMKYTRPGFAAWSATWNSLPCDRVGLAINAGSGNAPVFDLFALRIMSDGFDDVSM